jgi:hypothetical protein
MHACINLNLCMLLHVMQCVSKNNKDQFQLSIYDEIYKFFHIDETSPAVHIWFGLFCF